MTGNKSKVKNLRNILQSPFHVQWCEKNEEEIIPIQNALKELLPSAKLERAVINAKRRKKENEDQPNEKEPNIARTYLAPGFRSVMRSLEKKELCCIVLSNDITPPLMLNVVMVQALKNNIPTSVIPELRSITKSTLGFPSSLLGFKNTVADSPDNIFHPVYRLVSQNPTVCDAPFIIDSKQASFKEKTVAEKCTGKTLKVQSSLETLYHYRKGITERAFIPSNVFKRQLKAILKSGTHMSGDFISFGEPQQKQNISLSTKQNNDSEHLSEDLDESESDENMFFVDTQRDERLLENDNVKQAQVVLKPSFNTTKRDSNKMPQIGISYKLKNFKEASFSKSRNRNKNKINKNKSTTTVKTGSGQTSEIKHSKINMNTVGVNFKPLNIKAVLNNNKKIKTKKRKRNSNV